MRAGSWKLPTGMVLGLAVGFLLRPVVMTERGDLRWFEGPGATEANAAGSETVSGKSTAGSFGKRTAGSPSARLSSGDAVEDVRSLIGMIDVDRDPINHINLMELIRRMYLQTQLGESEVVEVLSGLSKEDGLDPLGIKKMAGVIALTRLAELNGPEALRLMCSEDLDFMSDDSEDWLSVMVMNSWVAADPDGAKQWFEAGMKRPDQVELMQSDNFRQAYYDGMAKHDAEALSRWIGDESDPEKRDGVLIALVRNTENSAELVGLLDHCAGESVARTEAIDKLSESDPLAAAAWVEKQVADGARDEDIATVSSAMMERDSEKGIEWYLAQELSDGKREGCRLSGIVDHLAYRARGDLQKAAEWVESRPDDAARDSAEIALARRFARTDPDKAMDWLMRVEDSATRDPALQEILHDRWDPLEDRLRDGVIEAAERAGMGEAARSFKPKPD